MNPPDNENIKSVEKTIENRLSHYKLLFVAARTVHYSIGVIGLTCSLMATSGFGGGDTPRYWALGSGICYGIFAFVDPNSKYLKFSQAAKVLEPAYLKYKCGDLPIPELIKSLEQAEDVITNLEKTETTSQQQLNQAIDSNGDLPISEVIKSLKQAEDVTIMDNNISTIQSLSAEDPNYIKCPKCFGIYHTSEATSVHQSEGDRDGIENSNIQSNTEKNDESN
jgi:hypothetical protein